MELNQEELDVISAKYGVPFDLLAGVAELFDDPDSELKTRLTSGGATEDECQALAALLLSCMHRENI